jgi:hypothetical protein
MRTVTLVLIDPAGEVLGSLPPFEVAAPWWQEVGEIAERAGVQVLRLLHGERPAPPGGHVTYLAETATGTAARPVRSAEIDRTAQPHRAAYAEVGGPAATLEWAARRIGPAIARQQRTWNLSAIWRLDDGDRPIAWIKQVPAFFAHEPDAIRLVAAARPGLVPPLIADDRDGRMLLAHIPGRDGYGAGAGVCDRIAEAFHPVQEHLADQAGELAAAGIPDRRRLDLTFAGPYLPRIPGLAELLDDLPRRLAAIDDCGLPATLVHGDLHPGNVRVGDDDRLTVMDWGDCYLGHPALDVLRLTEGLTDPETVLDRWAYRWEVSVPGSEPRRAAELMRPVAMVWAAETYARFLAAIEPAEHPYHAADVPEQLAAAVAVAGAEPPYR